MVVTCYSRTCNRPELPIFSASWKRVRAYVRASVRTHTIATTRSTSEQPRNRREHIWVPSVNGYVAFFDVSVPPLQQRRRKRRRWRRRERREARWWRRKASCFSSLSFFSSQSSLSSTSPVSLCTLLSYSFISFLLRYSINVVGRGLLRLILVNMYFLSPRLSPQTVAARSSLFPDVWKLEKRERTSVTLDRYELLSSILAKIEGDIWSNKWGDIWNDNCNVVFLGRDYNCIISSKQ